jgi:CubicO group peptidase (beta-lactamase class C family)
MWDFPGDLGGVGALRSTLSDMLKLGAALAGRGRTTIDESIALALVPMRESEGGNATGYGWITSEYGGEPVHWHNGGTAGSRSIVAVNRRSKTAAVVLVESAVSFDDLAMHLVDATRPPKRKRVVLATDAATLAQYAGTYQLAPNFRLEVFVEGERLMTRATGQNAIEISRYGEDTFFAHGVDAQLVFHRKEDGTAGSVTLHQNGRATFAPRVP